MVFLGRFLAGLTGSESSSPEWSLARGVIDILPIFESITEESSTRGEVVFVLTIEMLEG